MKKRYLFLLTSLHLTAAYSLPEVETFTEKLYIESSQVRFIGKEIFLLVDENFIRVDSVKTDFLGLYAERGYWVCPACGQKNRLGCWDCDHCEYTVPFQ